MISVAKEHSSAAVKYEMMKKSSHFKLCIGLCLIIFQVSNCRRDVSVLNYLVRIQLHDDPPCAGTLVNKYTVLTSVRCAGINVDALVITTLGVKKAKVREIIVPEEYNPETGYMDVALLQLEEPITGFDARPAKLCYKTSSDLPPAETVINSYYVIDEKDYPNQLFYGVQFLTVSDKDKCSTNFNETLGDTLFCVKNEYYKLPGSGGPVNIDGELCAIQSSKSNDAFVGFTSLANPKVKEFLDDILNYNKQEHPQRSKTRSYITG